MRLIDTDAEIARIRQEIERIEAKINRLEKLIEEEPLNTFHDFAEELERCYRNKADCQAEISALTKYLTAYDVDKVVEQINDLMVPEEEYRHKFCGTVTDEHCANYENCEDCLVEQFSKVIKSGGID